MSILEAAASGDRRATLVALRNSIAGQIEGCKSGRDMAALSKRLIEVMDEIKAIDDEGETDDIDVILNEL